MRTIRIKIQRYCLAAVFATVLASSVQMARADMIVVASTAPGIEVNTLLPAGTSIRIPDGASVTLIDVHQQTIEIVAPGGIVPGDPGQPTAESEAGSFIGMLKRFFTPEAAPKLGATRGGKPKSSQSADCHTLANDIKILLEKGCDERALDLWQSMQSKASSSLYLGTSKGSGQVSYRFGETIQLEAKANFDAYLYCFHQASDGTTTRFIPFFGSTPRLNANAVGRLPGSLASGDFYIQAGAPEGQDRVKCFATEYDIAPQFPDVLSGSPDLGKNMLDRIASDVFGQVATRVAQADLAIEVHN